MSGAVSAGCLAEDGHEVIGVDPKQTKVDLDQSRHHAHHREGHRRDHRAAGRGRALARRRDVAAAVRQTELSLICVGTPSQPNGGSTCATCARVCEQIGAALRGKPGSPVVVARSTMLPGTMRDVVIPTLEARSGKRAGVDFGVCNNPEFLREGTAVHDYLHPPKTVIGEPTRAAATCSRASTRDARAPLVRTDIETAEMVKYADNAWHALKVGFANEIGNICKALGIDSHEVMDIFCQDTKLNLSPYYLKPGFAFGGSCLPKDLRALLTRRQTLDLRLPICSTRSCRATSGRSSAAAR